MEGALDVLKSSICGSRRCWIAAITGQETIPRILEHLGLQEPGAVPRPRRGRPRSSSWRGRGPEGKTVLPARLSSAQTPFLQ